MRYVKLFENFNKDSWKDKAYKQLASEYIFNNFDEMFSFIDYYISISDVAEEWNTKETTIRKRLESYYDSPPTAEEEWFPMYLQDGEYREHIMGELGRIYNDISFKPSMKYCNNGGCNNTFMKKSRYDIFCSDRCRSEYDKAMAKGDW
jgi:hypothetical protein